MTLRDFPLSRWFILGLRLGLLYPTLNDIEASHRNDAERCLIDCLAKWLERADMVDKYGDTTFETLVLALKGLGEDTIAAKVSSKDTNRSLYFAIFLVQNNHILLPTKFCKHIREYLTSYYIHMMKWLQCIIVRLYIITTRSVLWLSDHFSCIDRGFLVNVKSTIGQKRL